jgi:NAD(P)-dependent dehydrogenase (short-subunit alcohol dehydrogenase family)
MQTNPRSALVSGGASGLGAATARRLVNEGWNVVIADRDGARAARLADEIGAIAVTMDVTEPAQVEAAVRVATEAGALRLVVNCAGIGWATRTLDRMGTPHDPASFQVVVQVNLFGTFNVLRIAAAAMAKGPPDDDGCRGCIVNTASVAAFDGQIGQLAYAASKGGVVAMTLPAARDLAPVGVRVVAIAPGIFDTPMVGLLPAEKRAETASQVVFPKRLGVPDDYAELVVAIERNRYLNGEVIRLDGGLRMPPR